MTRALRPLLMIALIAAWISPACATRSGAYALMEICGAFGVKTVAVPAEQAPQTPHKKSVHDCPFCLAAAQQHGLKTASILTAPYAAPDAPLQESCVRIASAAGVSQLPRGPPLSFV